MNHWGQPSRDFCPRQALKLVFAEYYGRMNTRGRPEFQRSAGPLPGLSLGAAVALPAIIRDTPVGLLPPGRRRHCTQGGRQKPQVRKVRLGVGGVMRSPWGINFPKPSPGWPACRKYPRGRRPAIDPVLPTSYSHNVGRAIPKLVRPTSL
jgi:hypothetical protein